MANVIKFFKDDIDFIHTPMGVSKPLMTATASASVYNRLGNLMSVLAMKSNIELAAIIAVWLVESDGRTHKPGKAIIRFENHLLRRQLDLDEYKKHFMDDGLLQEPGKGWKGHKWRVVQSGNWLKVHTDQIMEYDVLTFTRQKYGDEIALKCISIGGPQILISNHKCIGYVSPTAMYEAFQQSERWHVLGFFDFCENCMSVRGVGSKYLTAKDWKKFAAAYNGPGNAEVYGTKIEVAYRAAKETLQEL